ncbi:histidine kinase [Nocardia sp. NPDC057440]|uniref:sensor histidine kinase n=1 Tax=Nocardia sp. NPDC057440 TaxID=3346134 RepID=UPI00366D2B28
MQIAPQVRLARGLTVAALALNLASKISQSAEVTEGWGILWPSAVVVMQTALFVPVAFRRVNRRNVGVLLAGQAGLSYLLYFTCSPYATVTNLLLATILLAFRPGPAWLAVGPVLFGEFAVRYWATQDPGMRPYWAVLATVGTGVGLYAQCWLHDLIQQRQEAKADVARLEAAQERLRVARDLCESLCDRLAGLIVVFDRVWAAPDPRAELAAAVHTARDALATVRAVAADHGRWSLTGELAATGAVLEALGITALIRSDGAALPTPVDELLARALRATVLSWTSEQPPREVRITVADGRLRIEGDSSPPVATGLAAEVAGAGGELTTGPGRLDIRLSATPAATLAPLAAMPWLAWWALVVLEIDLFGTTLLRQLWYGTVTSLVVVVPVGLSLLLASGIQLYHGLPRPGVRPPAWPWTLALQALLIGGAVAAIGSSAIIYVTLFVGNILFLIRPRYSWLISAVVIACSAAFWVPPAFIGGFVATGAGLALMAYALIRLPEAAYELDQSRQDLARMAVLDERLRVARDLHDLLGFRLSAIVMKGELTDRLIGVVPDRASAELADLRDLAEQAMADVKAIISDPVPLSVAQEVVTARAVLAAAGIDVRVQLPVLPAAADALFAVVLREAVTNVVRHARATRCLISANVAGPVVRLSVANDGSDADSCGSAASGSRRTGDGLDNLTRRVAEAGGRLDVHRSVDWFTVHVEVPTVTGSEPAGVRGDPDGVHPVAGVQLGHG